MRRSGKRGYLTKNNSSESYNQTPKCSERPQVVPWPDWGNLLLEPLAWRKKGEKRVNGTMDPHPKQLKDGKDELIGQFSLTIPRERLPKCLAKLTIATLSQEVQGMLGPNSFVHCTATVIPLPAGLITAAILKNGINTTFKNRSAEDVSPLRKQPWLGLTNALLQASSFTEVPVSFETSLLVWKSTKWPWALCSPRGGAAISSVCTSTARC